jgi:outer membrane protein
VAGDYNIQTKLRDLEAAHFNYFSARQDIINQVVIAYYSVISAKEEIKVNEQALKTAEESLKRVTRLLEEKLKTKLEMNQAEIQKAKSENDLINSKKRWADNLDKLAVLIGLSSRDELNIFYEFTDIIKEYDEKKLIEDCISYRKELQTAMIKISQSKATYDYNKNQYLPAINYVAQYNSNYSPSAISGYFYYPGPTWYTGFQGQYNFFNLQDRENIKIANRELDLKKDDYRQKTEDFIEEVTTTLRAYRSYIELKKINLIQVKNAEESLEVAQKKYKEGLPIDYLNITKAQDDIVRAKNDLLNAEIRMILSQVNLERSAGYNLLNLFGVKDNYEK